MKELSKTQLKAVAGGATYFPGTKIEQAPMSRYDWQVIAAKQHKARVGSQKLTP